MAQAPVPARTVRPYHNRQPAHFAALLTAEQLSGLCPRQEHQQQQTKPVNKIQNVYLMPGGFRQTCGERQSSEQSGAQHHTRQDFADYFWLSELDEEVTEKLRQPDEQQKYEENRS